MPTEEFCSSCDLLTVLPQTSLGFPRSALRRCGWGGCPLYAGSLVLTPTKKLKAGQLLRYCRIVHVSATSGNDASYEDSLSFTRPSFASPDFTMWIGFLLGFLPSFTRSITLPHEGSGDRVKHYPESILTTPIERLRVAKLLPLCG